MTWTLLLYGILPLVAFVVADLMGGVKIGVVAAIVAALLDVGLTRWSLGEWDPGSFLALGLVIVLGAVSVKVENSIYFKMQPAVQSFVFAGLLAYFQLHGPTIGQRYLPLVRQMLDDPSLRAQLDNPRMVAFLDGTFVWMIPFFTLFGIFIGLVAWRCKTVTWLLWRGVGFWVVFLPAFVVVRAAVFLLESG